MESSTLPLTAIKQYRDVSDRSAPGAVLVPSCPYCGQRSVVTLDNFSHDTKRDTVSASGNCPSCNRRCHTWSVFGKKPETGPWKPQVIFVHPPVRDARAPFAGRDQLPVSIQTAYDQAVEVYEAGVWAGAITLLGRTIETAVEDLKTRQGAGAEPPTGAGIQGVLEAQFASDSSVARLTESIELAARISERLDPQHLSDEAAAEHMLELVEHLLDYLYSAPKRIDAARESLLAFAKATPAKTARDAA